MKYAQKFPEYCGVGLGLRWSFLEDVLEQPPLDVAFFEVSPENYMKRGGYFPGALNELSERYRMVTHGLTMGVGSSEIPSDDYFAALQVEIERVGSPWHSDHLCITSAGSRIFHDLLPLHLTMKEAERTADNIKRIQDKLGIPFGIENVSFYAHPAEPEMSELDFLCAILDKSECGLLLDVNNVYVNAVNHGYCAWDFISELPLDHVMQLHLAGHKVLPASDPAAGMLLDTHGAPVVDPVKDLFEKTLRMTGPVPVLLERDNEVPPLADLLQEVHELQSLYDEVLQS